MTEKTDGKSGVGELEKEENFFGDNYGILQ